MSVTPTVLGATSPRTSPRASREGPWDPGASGMTGAPQASCCRDGSLLAYPQGQGAHPLVRRSVSAPHTSVCTWFPPSLSPAPGSQAAALIRAGLFQLLQALPTLASPRSLMPDRPSSTPELGPSREPGGRSRRPRLLHGLWLSQDDPCRPPNCAPRGSPEPTGRLAGG